MDALELLKRDHDKVNMAFEQFKQGVTVQQAEVLFNQIYNDLTLHTAIEEQIFYPAVANHPETQALVKESYKEHAEAKETLTKLAGMDKTSSNFSQGMSTLIQEITQHVKEEEGELFPKVRLIWSKDQLEQLGDQLAQAKQHGITATAS